MSLESSDILSFLKKISRKCNFLLTIAPGFDINILVFEKEHKMNTKFLEKIVNFLLTIYCKFGILSIACGKEEIYKKSFEKNLKKYLTMSRKFGILYLHL